MCLLKRKFLALLLAVILLLPAIFPSANAVSDVCFVAINDTLPESIPLAYVTNSIAYIPCSALSSFRIYHLYDPNVAVVLVYTSSQQITIDMNTGIATDKDGMTYAATALYRNGQVYVPASFICSMFGLRASYIEGNGQGDICRITDGSEVLGDALFLSAATNLMRSRYAAYQQSVASPSPTPAGTLQPQGKATIYLTFLGLPTNYLLNLLKNYNVTATFFLSEENIIQAPDTVRRIVGDGHNVGIYCPEGLLWEVPQVSELLFEAAHVKTVLVTAGLGAGKAFYQDAVSAGYVPCQYDINGIAAQNGQPVGTLYLIDRLNTARGRQLLMLGLDGNNDTAVRSVITHLYTNDENFGLTTVREVGYTGGKNYVG